MSRSRTNFLAGLLTSDLTNVATTLASPQLANLPAITAPDYALLTLDPLGLYGNPEVVHVTAHSGGSTSATIARGQEGTSARSHVAANFLSVLTTPAWRHAPTAQDWVLVGETRYNVQTDRSYDPIGSDNTTAIQNTLTAAAGGGRVVFPPNGAYTSRALAVANPTNLKVEGPGATITWTGTGTGPQGYVGLELTGTAVNVDVEGLRFKGDGVAANYHAGVWMASTVAATKVSVVRCYLDSLAVGIEFGNAALTGTADGCLAEGNFLTNIVGTVSGSGYGIVASGSTPTRIIDNEITGGQRHDIYVSAGAGRAIVTGNLSKNHRSTVTDGSLKPAIVIARVQSCLVALNEIENAYDGCISCEPDASAGQQVRNVQVVHNILRDPHGPAAIWVGSDSAASVQDTQFITVESNDIYTSNAIVCIRVRSGFRIVVTKNRIWSNSVTGEMDGIEVACIAETAGTANYSDLIEVSDNVVGGPVGSGGVIVPLLISTTAAAAGSNILFRNNRRLGSGNLFNAATLTNSAIFFEDQVVSGISSGAYPRLRSGASDTYSGNGVPPSSLGVNGDFYERADGVVSANTVLYHKESGSWVALTTT